MVVNMNIMGINFCYDQYCFYYYIKYVQYKLAVVIVYDKMYNLFNFFPFIKTHKRLNKQIIILCINYLIIIIINTTLLVIFRCKNNLVNYNL